MASWPCVCRSCENQVMPFGRTVRNWKVVEAGQAHQQHTRQALAAVLSLERAILTKRVHDGWGLQNR